MSFVETLEKALAAFTLSDEDKVTKRFIEAVSSENWIMCQHLAREYDLGPAELFDRVAEAACYAYATGVEPKRSAAWTALKTTLETLQYPLWADAVDKRYRRMTGQK
jgi:hypothetical protein